MDSQSSRGVDRSGSFSAGPGTAGVDPAEFAEYLRAERERRQLTLDQIADETKIASRHLAALERGDVRNWPGGMYRRAMMRAYAESIGVDREYALKQFEQAFDAPASHADPAAPPSAASMVIRRWRPSTRQLLAAGATILAVAAVFIGWNFSAGLMADKPGEAPAAVAEPVHAATEPRAGKPAPADAPRAAAAAPPVLESVATTGASEPQPLATDGTLAVTSQPAGARVTVNGIGWGETPITIRHLEFGQKRVRLTMQGYISQERIVSLGPERPRGAVRLTLPAR